MPDITTYQNILLPNGPGASLVRAFWDQLDLTKTLYSRFDYVSTYFDKIIEDLAQESKLPNIQGVKMKRFLWVMEHLPCVLGQELNTEVFEARKRLGTFYKLKIEAKKKNVSVTEEDLYLDGLTEEMYLKTLSCISRFCALVYNLEINPHVLEIIKDVTDDEKSDRISIPMEELEMSGEDELAENKSYRFPFVIIIDNSISMQENKRFESLQRGLKELFDRIYSHTVLSSRVELYVATCEREPKEIVNFAMIDKQIITLNQLNLTQNGPCRMATTIEMALDRLKARLDLYSDSSYDIKYFRPWMLILSDGKFKEDMSKAIERIHKDFDDLQVYARALSSKAKMDNLRLLDPHAAILESLEGFFKDVFVSLKRIKYSHPGGERVSLINQLGFTQNP